MNEGGIEFGHAEALALASTPTEEVHVASTGRGHRARHASTATSSFMTRRPGSATAPIQNLAEANAPLEPQ